MWSNKQREATEDKKKKGYQSFFFNWAYSIYFSSSLQELVETCSWVKIGNERRRFKFLPKYGKRTVRLTFQQFITF